MEFSYEVFVLREDVVLEFKVHEVKVTVLSKPILWCPEYL
jgi:hypothetical protein